MSVQRRYVRRCLVSLGVSRNRKKLRVYQEIYFLRAAAQTYRWVLFSHVSCLFLSRCSIVSLSANLSEDGVHVEAYTPFIYVDVSDSSNLALYIQQLPSGYNVTEYKVWLIKNDTQSIGTISTIVPASKSGGHVQYNFSLSDGIYYVKVAALHPECGEHGCANSTTPFIYISKYDCLLPICLYIFFILNFLNVIFIFSDRVSNRLLIMIISLIWIPPVIVYALYHAFKIYRKKGENFSNI